MLSFGQLDAARLARVMARAGAAPTTAPPHLLVAAVQGTSPPRRWFVDRTTAALGRGQSTFDAAAAALWAWVPFEQPWLTAVHAGPPRPGATAAVIVHLGPLWSTNACRVTKVVDTASEASFVYATVPGHGERGEERFSVILEPDGTVRWEVLAVSRPAAWYTALGLPYVRVLQRRFRHDTVPLMQRAIERREHRDAHA